MIVQRVLSIAAAVLLVVSVALATLGPRSVPLANALYWLDHGFPERMRAFLEGYLGSWTWGHVAIPLLARPVWMIPATLGIICAGLAVSASGRKSARQSHRRS